MSFHVSDKLEESFFLDLKETLHLVRLEIMKLSLVFLLFFSLSSFAGEYSTDYLKFSSTLEWTCKKFGNNTACHHKMDSLSPVALILIAAKVGKISDKPEDYIQLFKKSPERVSDAVVKTLQIDRQTWVQGFFRALTIPGMREQYLATVCCPNYPSRVHFLVSLHASKVNYAFYQLEFAKITQRIKLAAISNELLRQIAEREGGDQSEFMGYLSSLLAKDKEMGAKRTPTQGSPWKPVLGAFLLLLLSYLAYELWALGKRPRRRRRRRRR